MNNAMIAEEDKDARASDKSILTIINCNARSLCPKLESLIDNMIEADAVVGIVTETLSLIHI